VGAISGSVVANAMFEVGTSISTKERATPGHLLGEVIATAGLILLIFALAATKRGALAAPAVGAYIGAAYWFTSSTSFANPAVTVGRIFSDTFAGIAPASVPGFVVAQLIGAAVGLGLLLILFPSAARTAEDVVLPHSLGKTSS
jgi:glycerol uptake facilitator-like aquaporin